MHQFSHRPNSDSSPVDFKLHHYPIFRQLRSVVAQEVDSSVMVAVAITLNDGWPSFSPSPGDQWSHIAGLHSLSSVGSHCSADTHSLATRRFAILVRCPARQWSALLKCC